MRKLSSAVVEAVKDCRNRGLTMTEAAAELGLPKEKIRSVCSNYKITGWPAGAAARDQTGINNPSYINGLSKATINRKTKATLESVSRDLFTCERCGHNSKIELPRHHKDRDRSNNLSENLEVLCTSCHMKEHNHERIRYKGKYTA